MPTFNVTLSRAYKVTVKARNRTMAEELVEFFLGDPKDASLPAERKKYGFSIEEIEMVDNEAIEVERYLG